MEMIPAQGALLERVLDETCSTFGGGLDRRKFGRWDAALAKTPWAVKNRRRFALVDGSDLLASAVLYNLAGVCDGRPVRIAGIGSLFTNAAHLGCGHSQRLVERLLEQAESADLALLFPDHGAAERGESYGPSESYESYEGFEPLPSQTATLKVTESTRRGAPMTMVRGGEERDLAAIVAMGRARAETFRFHLDRDVELLHYAVTNKRLAAGLAASGARQLQFFIAEEGITAAAYVIVSSVGRTWTVEECGDRDPSGARLGALLQALIARDAFEDRPTIQARMPHAFLPPQVTAIASTMPAQRVMARTLTGPPAAFADDQVLYWNDDVF